MRRWTDWLRGYARVRVEGGSPQWCLNRLTAAHVPFWGLETVDEFTVCFLVYQRDLSAVTELAAAGMCVATPLSRCGLPGVLALLSRRWGLMAGLAAAVAAALILPQYVWFYRVEGNDRIPAERILRAVRDAGVTAGTYGPDIHPQQVRYFVQRQIPELEWLTVTQNGAMAVVTVRERRQRAPMEDRRTVRDLVASRGGMITGLSVLDGEAAVKKGDVVEPGQVLVSGHMDLTYKIRACAAAGEVFARTWRETDVVTPRRYTAVEETGKIWRCRYLQMGRNRLKLTIGDPPEGPEWRKTVQRRDLTLPGGLTLPAALVTETYVCVRPTAAELTASAAGEAMKRFSLRLAQEDMIAGRIRNSDWQMSESADLLRLHATVEAEEMIARPRRAEWTEDEHGNDRTDH